VKINWSPVLVTDPLLVLHAAADDNAFACVDAPLMMTASVGDSGATLDDSRANFATST